MDWGDGGGFINETVAEDPQQVTTSVSVAGGDDKNKLIAAVSVSQVTKLTRPNEGLIIFNKKIYHVNLVGYVFEIVDMNQQKVHIMLDDHSGGGPLEVSHIIGDTGTPGQDPSLSMFDDRMTSEANPDQPRDIQTLRVGDYVRVVGVVKYHQDKANIVAYSLRIIEDPNEITMHIMEVIRDSIYYEKVLINNGANPPAIKDDAKQTGQNNNNHHQTGADTFGDLSTRDKHLIQFLRSKAGETGIHIDEIVRHFSALTKSDIVKSLTQLTQEGLCWTGDDENIWCV